VTLRRCDKAAIRCVNQASIKRQSASVEKTAAPICAACNVTASLYPCPVEFGLKRNDLEGLVGGIGKI
jgi:hypothetical protein